MGSMDHNMRDGCSNNALLEIMAKSRIVNVLFERF